MAGPQKAIPKDPSRRQKFVEVEIDAAETIEGTTQEQTVSLETQVAEMQAQMREMQASIDELQKQVSLVTKYFVMYVSSSMSQFSIQNMSY